MGRKRKSHNDEGDGLGSDLDDEIDAFAKAGSRIALNVSDEEVDTDSKEEDEEEEAVLDLAESSSDDDDEEEVEDDADGQEDSGTDDEEEESGSEDIGLDELEKDILQGGEIGELAEQTKAARHMLMKARAGSESGSDEDLANPESIHSHWGSSQQFYGADGHGMDIQEEDLQEEAREASKLQKQVLGSLKENDYDMGGASDLNSDSEDEKDVAEQGGMREPKGLNGKLSTAADSKKLYVTMKHSPELAALCSDLQESLSQIRTKIGPLVKEAREGGICTNEGLSYLEVKHHLLLHYCICITFYLLMKVEGKPVKDHPVILRLVEIRAFLEKIKPIDARLQYQVDKLLRAAQVAKTAEEGPDVAGEEEDALQFAPRPEALLTDRALGGENEDGIYKAPKINPVAMEEDLEAANEHRRQVEQRKRAAQSDMVNEMVQEITGAPDEVKDHTPGWDTAKAIRALKKMEQRSKMEEEMFTRVRFTKEEKKRFKAQKHRAGMSAGAVMADFADDVRHTLSAIEGSRSSQHFATDTIPQKGKPRSGDADLPIREAFKDQKKRFDQIRMAKKPQIYEEPEDEAQVAARQAKQEKLARVKAEKEKRRYTKPPSAPTTVEGPRAISREIQKNRGLTPNRRKDIKNPRKRQRIRYETAQAKRRGAVQKHREDGEHYGGEATGIKKNTAKSVRFK